MIACMYTYWQASIHAAFAEQQRLRIEHVETELSSLRSHSKEVEAAHSSSVDGLQQLVQAHEGQARIDANTISDLRASLVSQRSDFEAKVLDDSARAGAVAELEAKRQSLQDTITAIAESQAAMKVNYCWLLCCSS